jgi:hypothetical protein
MSRPRTLIDWLMLGVGVTKTKRQQLWTAGGVRHDLQSLMHQCYNRRGELVTQNNEKIVFEPLVSDTSRA